MLTQEIFTLVSKTLHFYKRVVLYPTDLSIALNDSKWGSWVIQVKLLPKTISILMWAHVHFVRAHATLSHLRHMPSMPRHLPCLSGRPHAYSVGWDTCPYCRLGHMLTLSNYVATVSGCMVALCGARSTRVSIRWTERKLWTWTSNQCKKCWLRA